MTRPRSFSKKRRTLSLVNERHGASGPEDNLPHQRQGALTFWAAEGGVANAGVLVAPKVEEGSTVVPVQKYSLVDHSLNNVWSQQNAMAGENRRESASVSVGALYKYLLS